jgi:hypothetical protein
MAKKKTALSTFRLRPRKWVEAQQVLPLANRVTESAQPGQRSVASPKLLTSGAATPAAEAAAATGESWFAKMMAKAGKVLKSPAGKAAGAAILAQMVIDQGKGLVGQIQEGRAQMQSLDTQSQYAPQIAKEQAIQPITKAQRDHAMMMLMRQMGAKNTQLAEGEVLT